MSEDMKTMERVEQTAKALEQIISRSWEVHYSKKAIEMSKRFEPRPAEVKDFDSVSEFIDYRQAVEEWEENRQRDQANLRHHIREYNRQADRLGHELLKLEEGQEVRFHRVRWDNDGSEAPSYYTVTVKMIDIEGDIPVGVNVEMTEDIDG